MCVMVTTHSTPTFVESTPYVGDHDTNLSSLAQRPIYLFKSFSNDWVRIHTENFNISRKFAIVAYKEKTLVGGLDKTNHQGLEDEMIQKEVTNKPWQKRQMEHQGLPSWRMILTSSISSVPVYDSMPVHVVHCCWVYWMFTKEIKVYCEKAKQIVLMEFLYLNVINI